ncbi:hypothetical protein GCM10027299_03180 [Larkinella ripae]
MNAFFYTRRIPLLIAVLLELTSLPLWSQTVSSIWQKTLGGRRYENIYATVETDGGGSAIAGVTFSIDKQISTCQSSADFWVVRFDENGGVRWQQTLGGSQDEHARALVYTPDGGFGVAGFTYSNDGQVTGNHGKADFWVVKLNSTGEMSWQRTLGGTKNDLASVLTSAADGGFLVAGSSESNDGQVTGNHGNTDGWVVRLNRDGEIVWQQSLGGSGKETITALAPTADGGFLLAGSTESNDGQVSGNHGKADYWIIKIDQTGRLLWQRTLGGSDDDLATALASTPDGGYVVAGNTRSVDGQVTALHGQRDYWVVRLDELGQLIWQQSLGGSQDDFATAITPTPDNSFLVAGYSHSSDNQVIGSRGREDGWLVKLDKTGRMVWQQPVGGQWEDRIYSLMPTANGDILAAGYTRSNSLTTGTIHGLADGWLMKLSLPDNEKLLIKSAEKNVWRVILLENPVQDGRISVEVRGVYGQQMHLQVTDPQGYLVAERRITLMREVEWHRFEVKNRPPGLFLLRASSPERVQTLKILSQ